MRLNSKIAFIGAGKMAETIISGIIRSKIFSPKQIVISDIDKNRSCFIKQKFKIFAAKDNFEAAKNSDVIFLSVKPQNISEVIGSIYEAIDSKKLVVSIAAGVSLKYLRKKMPKAKIIRVMPNNPCLIGEGISAVSASKNSGKKEKEFVKSIFSLLGKVLIIDEKHLDAITGLSGSGPAFIYSAIDGMLSAGEKLGLSRQNAKVLTIQTFIGAAKTMEQADMSAQDLINQVASPKGTTIEGLKVLDKRKFKKALFDAVIAAAKRASEIKKSLEGSL